MGIRPQRRSVWSDAEEFGKKHFLGWFEKIVGLKTISPESVDYTSIKRILIIRQHDQLGDFLLSIPALRAVRERFPKAWIAVLIREYFYDAAKLIPFVDDVIVFHEDSSRWTLNSLKQFWRKLRDTWDLTIVLNTVSHSLTSDLFAYFSRAPYVLGSGERVFPGASKNYFYNLIAPVATTVAPKHQSALNLDIVGYIGCTTKNLSEEITVPEEEKKKVKEELIKFGIADTATIIGLHIGAGKPGNRWPVEHFAKLAEIIHTTLKVQIMLFWGPAEDTLMHQFCRSITFKPINIGYPNLSHLSGYFSRCDILVCNDTGVMHLAAAANVQTVALFGPTNPDEWKPIGENVIALRSESGKIDTIMIDDVVITIHSLLRRQGTISSVAP